MCVVMGFGGGLHRCGNGGGNVSTVMCVYGV